MDKHTVDIVHKNKFRQLFCFHKWSPVQKISTIFGKVVMHQRCLKCGKTRPVHRIEV